MLWSGELKSALKAARVASDLILRRYHEADAMSAAAADITTQTDRDAQDAIVEWLARDYPDDAFRAEENTSVLASKKHDGPRMWIIDPIDGTRGFVLKNGEFSVMIALAVEGTVVVGVVAEPAFQRVTSAALGAGCWSTTGDSLAQLRHHVTTVGDFRGATLIQSHTKAGQGSSKEVRTLQPNTVVETYSAGVKLARVADGSADMYVCDYAAMNDWDLAAGHILVTEAGGRVTNLAGEERVYGQASPKQYGGLLATNGLIHEAVIQRLANP